jgi:hypothetical protein
MATRFGFMKSTKAGKCFYCKAEFAEGDRVGFDNNIKRRTCAACAERMIADGQNVPHDVPAEKQSKGLFKQTQFEQRMTALEEKFEVMMSRLAQFIGEE